MQDQPGFSGFAGPGIIRPGIARIASAEFAMNVRPWIAAALLVVPSFANGQDVVPREMLSRDFDGTFEEQRERRAQRQHRHTQMASTLREVINEGADLFNLQADYAGCYRLYQGSLVAIRPMLEHWQKRYVQEALTDAAVKATSAEKAYCLREAIDRIRAEAATPGEELLRAQPVRVDQVGSDHDLQQVAPTVPYPLPKEMQEIFKAQQDQQRQKSQSPSQQP
jgi:hypothetical protein